jgi:glycosyltransferase involved in cell wall biosynthesis
MVDISIIIPSFNRPEQLRGCLDALVQQDVTDFEVVVVDDGSKEPLSPVCETFDARVRCIRQKNAGPASARNTGAGSAWGDFLVFTDDDCRPQPDWLRNLIVAHSGMAGRLVGGRVENGLPHDPYASTSQALCDFLYDYFGAVEGKMPFFTSNNMGCDRKGFERLGGFDRSFGLAAAEDRDFGLRWRDQVGELIYAPDAVICHYHAMNLRDFWRQHSNYGAGAFHLHRLLEARGLETPKRESFRFYQQLLLWPLRQNGVRGLPGTFLMGLTQLAMVSGYVKASRRTAKQG